MSLFSNCFLSAPSISTCVDTIPSYTNILHVSLEPVEGGSPQFPSQQVLLASTADRRFLSIDPTQNALVRSISHVHDSPILSCVLYSPKCLITISSAMSGQTVLYNHAKDRVLDERRDHKKYVVKLTSIKEKRSTWIATAGWDAKVFLYQIIDGNNPKLREPVAFITTTTNPESVTFIKEPYLDRPILIITRRDSTSLYYYNLPALHQELAYERAPPVELSLLGSQNLAPHSNAWMTFSPSSITPCPQDPTLLAVATSAVPHMSR